MLDKKPNANYYSEEIAPNFDYFFTFFIYRAIDLIGRDFNSLVPTIIENDTKINMEEIDSVLKFAKTKIQPLNAINQSENFLEIEREYSQMCIDEGLENIIPTSTSEGRRCSAFIKCLRQKEGYEHIKYHRNGKNTKHCVIEGICFSEKLDNDIFEETPTDAIRQQGIDLLAETLKEHKVNVSWNLNQ